MDVGLGLQTTHKYQWCLKNISNTIYFHLPNRKYCNYYLEKSVKMIFNGIVCVGILFTHSKLLLSLQDFFHNILRENQKMKNIQTFLWDDNSSGTIFMTINKQFRRMVFMKILWTWSQTINPKLGPKLGYFLVEYSRDPYPIWHCGNSYQYC